MGSQPAPLPLAAAEYEAPVAEPVAAEPAPLPVPPAPVATAPAAPAPSRSEPKAKESKPAASKPAPKTEELSGWKKLSNNVRRFANYVDKPPKE